MTQRLMGSIFGSDMRSLEEQRADEARGARAAAARTAGLIELKTDSVTTRGRYFVAHGLLYERPLHLVVDERGIRHADGTYYFFEAADGDAVILAQAGLLEDLEAREAEEARDREAAAQAQRDRYTADRRPVTLADLEQKKLPNLQAATRLVTSFGGEITARGDELVVELSAAAMRSSEVRDACRVLYAAAPAVLDALAKTRTRKQPLDDLLLDEPVRASGRVG